MVIQPGLDWLVDGVLLRLVCVTKQAKILN
jgi:hypothetical protein